MTTPEKRQALDDAIDALLEADVEAPDLRPLEELLRDDPEAVRHYLHRIDLHHSLKWAVTGETFREAVAAARPPRTSRLTGLAAAAAVLLAAGILWTLAVPRPATPPSAPTVAAVVEGGDAGASVPAGPYRLDRGTARLSLPGGVELLVQGPAELRLDSRERATLHSGSLTVAAGADPFTVEAPGLTLLNRGAEFGIGVREGRVRLHVFRGEVSARIPGPVPQDLRVTRDESLRLDPDGTLTTNIIGDTPGFARLRGTRDPSVPFVANSGFEYPRTPEGRRLAAAGWVLRVHPLANLEDMPMEHGAGVTSGPNGGQWGFLTTRTFPDGRRYHTSMHQAVGRAVPGSTLELRARIGPSDARFAVSLRSGTRASGPGRTLVSWTPPPGVRDLRLTGTLPADVRGTLFLVFETVPGASPGRRTLLLDDVRLTPVERSSP